MDGDRAEHSAVPASDLDPNSLTVDSTSARTTFDPDQHPYIDTYRLLTATVVPRPIAWVSTLSASGVLNLAPYSFFTVTSADPPIVQFSSIGHKDSWRNILDTNEFVVNIGTEKLIEAMNHTSAPFDPTVDEFQQAGVTPEESAVVGVPRVSEAPISIECRRHIVLDIGNTCVIMGRIVNISIDKAILSHDGLPDYAKFGAPSRLGRNEWGLAPGTIEIKRPSRRG